MAQKIMLQDKKKTGINWKYIPMGIACLIILIGVVTFNQDAGMIGNFILLGMVVGVGPYLLMDYLEWQKIKAIEDALPTFLLDLSEMQKTGMTLPDSLRQASKTDYGKLTDEIKIVNNQISWGIPMQDSLEKFSIRMEKSSMIRRTIRIINDAYSSGGDVSRTMETIASDITTIKEAEKERKSAMQQHVMVMYAIYFVFIGILIGLSKTLIPMLNINMAGGGMSGGIMGFQDPCAVCATNPAFACISCSIFSLLCSMFKMGTGGGCYYHALFLLMTIVQGLCSGLVAGQIGEGSAKAGIKHAAIMTASGFAIFLLALQLGVM